MVIFIWAMSCIHWIRRQILRNVYIRYIDVYVYSLTALQHPTLLFINNRGHWSFLYDQSLACTGTTVCGDDLMNYGGTGCYILCRFRWFGRFIYWIFDGYSICCFFLLQGIYCCKEFLCHVARNGSLLRCNLQIQSVTLQVAKQA